MESTDRIIPREKAAGILYKKLLELLKGEKQMNEIKKRVHRLTKRRANGTV